MADSSRAQKDAAAACNREALIASADKCLAKFLPITKELYYAADDAEDVTATLYEGSISIDDVERLWQYLPSPISTLCEQRSKAHVHVQTAALARMESGKAFLDALATVLQPMIKDGPYKVIQAEVVANLHNDNPFHQDVLTGKRCFSRDLVTPKAGIRLLIDLGSYEQHESRNMCYATGCGYDKVIYETKSRLVGMSARAAGSGGEGPFFHGRSGDGVTVSVDLVLPTRDRSGKPYHAGVGCFKYFGTTMTYLRHGSHNIGGYSAHGPGRGTAHLTRIHNVEATRKAMLAADTVVAQAAGKEDVAEADVEEDVHHAAFCACLSFLEEAVNMLVL